MSTRWRRPLQPRSPPSANIVSAKYTYSERVATDGFAAMNKQAREDAQGEGSIVSGLTDLESEADDFDKLMIQNARDERRLNDAVQGKVQPFRKARIHPRVGLTLENLERNSARSNGAPAAVSNAHVQFQSPPSSSGSARSDPTAHPPVAWGRRGRVRRDWLRTITSDDEQRPGAQEDTVDRLAADEESTPRREAGRADRANADTPLPSMEDSPLSHKKSLPGTPSSTRRRNAGMDRLQDLDYTFDLNEASVIASTPYIPRNTALDDIRAQEIESLREQALATDRLDRLRDGSPEAKRRPRSSSARSTGNGEHGEHGEQSLEQENLSASSELRLRKRTNSWKNIGKSQAVTGEIAEHSPITVYKTRSETVEVVNAKVPANAPPETQRPTHRREDSQDLLRRLARVSSNTPSPGRSGSLRPQSAPAGQPGSSSQTMASATAPVPSSREKLPSQEESTRESSTRGAFPADPEARTRQRKEEHRPRSASSLPQQPQPADVDATPMPEEQTVLNPKTPVVTGAWVDTPVPRTARRPSPSRRASGSPTKGSPSKQKSSGKQAVVEVEEVPEVVPVERVRPNLPGSALEAIVEEAKAKGTRRSDDFGDSTINSLEDLISPTGERSAAGEQDEDTLLGLQLPTGEPKNEAERQRQQEVVQLHRMKDKLRATRTSIRDASRGMRRVENRVDHFEGVEGVEGEEAVRIVYRDCPCAVNGCHQLSFWSLLWRDFKRLFYDPRLRPTRRAGLTWLSVFLLSFLTWFITENIACEKYCHKFYATSQVGYGVVWDAPRYPYVLPTLFYRNLMKPWWIPLWASLSWIWTTSSRAVLGVDQTATVRATATKVAKKATKVYFKQSIDEHGSLHRETVTRMADDELLY